MKDAISLNAFRRNERLFCTLFTIVLLLAVGSPESVARAEERGGDLYALIVGLAKYKDPKILQLTVSDKDARDFAEFLKSQNKLFRNLHVTLLRNEEATKAEVEKHLYYKLRQAGKDDTVVLFFSGHGADDPYTPGEFFFLTYDAELEFLKATAVDMGRQTFLNKLDSKRVLLIADACHAGGFSLQGAKSSPPSFQNVASQFKDSEGKIFLTSSKRDELSREKPGMPNSVFTYYLLQGLKGEADKDNDGVVTLSELYDYVYQKTKGETKGFQSPQMDGRIVGRFPLALARSHRDELQRPDRPSQASLPAPTPPRPSTSEESEAAKLQMLANQGDARAQMKLAEMYEFGTGVAKDETEARKWLRKAAEQGDRIAQVLLGDMYLKPGVSQDYKEAIKWIRKSAEQGNADAQWLLGDMYGSGRGIGKNLDEAIKWYQKAASQKNKTGMERLRMLGVKQPGSTSK